MTGEACEEYRRGPKEYGNGDGAEAPVVVNLATPRVLTGPDGIWRACSEATAHRIKRGEAGTPGVPAPYGDVFRRAVHSEAAPSVQRLECLERLSHGSVRIVELPLRSAFLLKPEIFTRRLSFKLL
jgi:hypothetical protein